MITRLLIFTAVSLVAFVSSTSAQDTASTAPRYAVFQYKGALVPVQAAPAADDEATSPTSDATETTADDTATTPSEEVSAESEALDAEELLKAVLSDPAVKAAMETPLDNAEVWEPKLDREVDTADSHRQGVILAIDSSLQIKRTKTDLTDSIITTIEALMAGDSGSAQSDANTASMDSKQQQLKKAYLLILHAELSKEDASAQTIAKYLNALEELSDDEASASDSTDE
jgi:hypothetical protein